MEIQGQIETVEGKSTSKGTVYEIKIKDGETYSTWDQAVATEARNAVGSVVTADVAVKQNGKYTNRYWNGFTPAAGAHSNATQTTPTVSAPIPQQPASTPSDKDAQIARAVALKAAVDMANGGLLGEPTPALVVATAQQFEPYLLGVAQPAGKVATPWDES